jgi:hypothetical protein
LLCERALCPGEANAQPPVCGELIGGAGWELMHKSPVRGCAMRCTLRVADGGGDGDGVVDVDDLAINGSPLLQKCST